MKKRLVKIAILVLLFILSFSITCQAASNFRVGLKNGLSIKNGHVLEIPVILDDIKLDQFQGIQDGIIEFSCNIKYDEDVFSFLEYKENLVKCEKEINGITQEIAVGTSTYNKEAKKLVYRLEINYINEIQSSNINKTEIGTFKFMANEDALKGNYDFEVLNVYGGNDEKTSVEGNGIISQVFVDGKTENQNDNPDNDDIHEPESITGNQKAVKYEIKQSDDRKKITLIPDEINGCKIGYITVDGSKVSKNNNGVFEFDTIPNTTYNIYIFDINGKFLCNDYVVTLLDDLNQDVYTYDNENNKEDDKDNTENVDSAEGTDKKDEQPTNNEKKSPQTGDYIYIAVAILAMLTCIWIVIFFKRK